MISSFHCFLGSAFYSMDFLQVINDSWVFVHIWEQVFTVWYANYWYLGRACLANRRLSRVVWFQQYGVLPYLSTFPHFVLQRGILQQLNGIGGWVLGNWEFFSQIPLPGLCISCLLSRSPMVFPPSPSFPEFCYVREVFLSLTSKILPQNLDMYTLCLFFVNIPFFSDIQHCVFYFHFIHLTYFLSMGYKLKEGRHSVCFIDDSIPRMWDSVRYIRSDQ